MQIYEQFLVDAIHPEARLKMRGNELLKPSECPWYMNLHFRTYATYLSPEFQVNLTIFDRGALAQLKPFHYSRRVCLELVVESNSEAKIQPAQEKVEVLYRELASLL